MKCHDNKNHNNGSHKHNPIKHMLHMVLCCGLPILIIGLLPVISKVSPGASKLLAGIAPFICPLMMFFMIPMMFGGNKKGSCCDNKNNENSSQLELDKAVE